jgi:hypothetical protein
MYDFNLELKQLETNGFFSGYASIFNVKDSHHDMIQHGAFSKSLLNKNARDIKLLWQHQMEQPIGVINTLKEDQYGLYIEAKLLLDIVKAKEAYSLLRNKIISGLSIGYQVKESFYDRVRQRRVISEIDLYEVSLVTFPANSYAQITNVKNNFHSTQIINSIEQAITTIKT